MDNKLVLFLEDRLVQDTHVGTDKETRFKKDRVYRLLNSSALRWIGRGIATDNAALVEAAVKKHGVENEPAGEHDKQPEGPRFDAKVEIPDAWAGLKPGQKMDLARQLGAKKVQSGADAEGIIVEALFERAVAATFQVRQDGDAREVVVLEEWPTYIKFAADAVKNAEGCIQADRDRATITVANGIAVYALVTPPGMAVVGHLVEQTFEAPKPAAAQ